MNKELDINEDSGINYVIIPLEALQALSDPLTATHNVIINENGGIEIVNSDNISQAIFINDNSEIVVNEPIEKSSDIDLPIINNPEPQTIKLANKTNEVRYINRNNTNNRIIKKSLIRKGKESHPIKCLLCDKKFIKVSQYRLHMQEHRNDKKFKCNYCKDSFNVEDNFKVHMIMHSQGERVCPICNRKFARWASLKSHLTAHQVEESISCNDCLTEFDKEEDLNHHLENYHSIPEKAAPIRQESVKLECCYCNYEFDDFTEFKDHLKLHAKTKKFINNRVKRRHANSKELPNKCEHCNKTFSKICLLERHKRIHTGEKPFVCPECNKGFTQKGTLSLHMHKHNGVKPYQCYLCSARFTQKGNLRVHIEKTHTSTEPGEKAYKCLHCTCIFKKVSSLNAHVTKCHADSLKESEVDVLIEQLKELNKQAAPVSKTHALNFIFNDEKIPNSKYIKLAESNENGAVRRYLIKQRRIGDIKWNMCSYCTKEYKKPSDLIRHLRIHTKERPYQCDKCHLTFGIKSTLINHLQTHERNERFACAYCNSEFTSLRTLNVHLRKHDKNAVATISRPFQCSLCTITFATEAKAKAHLAAHEVKNQPILKQANNEIELKQPLVETQNGIFTLAPPKKTGIHAENYAKRRFKCHVCLAAFGKEDHLKNHMAVHSDKNSYLCPLCNKSFATESKFNLHVELHTKPKKFQCKNCPNKFHTLVALKRHEQLHSTIKPYICPYCNERFKQKMLCRRHIKMKHKQDNETNDLENIKLLHVLEGVEDDPMPQTFDDKPSLNNEIIYEEYTTCKKIQARDRIRRDAQKLDSSDKLNTDAQIDILPKTGDNLELDTNGDNINYPTTYYITADELQSLGNTNIVNALLPQFKLQNTDDLLQCSINEQQDASSFPLDTTDNQETQAFQEDIQNYDTFSPNLIFHSNINELTETESIKVPHIVNSSIAQIDLELNHLARQKVDVNMPDNLTILNNDTLKTNDINYYINYEPINDYIDINALNIAGNSIENKIVEESNEIVEINETNQEIVEETVATNDVNEVVEADAFVKPNKYTKKIKKKIKNTLKKLDVPCDYCDKFFSGKTSLFKHISVKHKEAVDNSCNFCHKTFKKKSDLNRHVRTHTGEKPFICEKCDKRFGLKSTLQSHYRTHDSVVGTFKCQVCDAFLSCKSSLKTHMKTHTHTRQKKSKKSDRSAVSILQSFMMETTEKIKLEQQETENLIYLTQETNVPQSENDTNEESLNDLNDTIDPMYLLQSQNYDPSIGLQLEINGQIINVKPAYSDEIIHHAKDMHLENDMTENCIMLHDDSETQNELQNLNDINIEHVDDLQFSIQDGELNDLQSKEVNDSFNDEFNLQHDNVDYNLQQDEFTLQENDVVIQEAFSTELIDLKRNLQLTDENDLNLAAINERDFEEIDTTIQFENGIQYSGDDLQSNDNIVTINGIQYQSVIPPEDLLNMQSANSIHLRGVKEDSVIQIHTSNGIVDHRKLKKLPKRFPKVQCEKCFKFYVSKSVLMKHNRKVHGTHTCPHCFKGFDILEHLERHMKIHIGYRPFSCSLCANSFMDVSSLKTHLNRIHNQIYKGYSVNSDGTTSVT